MRATARLPPYGASDMSLSEPGRPAEMAVGLRSLRQSLLTRSAPSRRLGRRFRPDEEHPGQPPRARHQPPILAEPLRRRRRHHRPHGSRRRRSSRDRRRAARELSATGVTWAVRPLPAARSRAKRKLATAAPPGSASSGVAPAPSAASRPRAFIARLRSPPRRRLSGRPRRDHLAHRARLDDTVIPDNGRASSPC